MLGDQQRARVRACVHVRVRVYLDTPFCCRKPENNENQLGSFKKKHGTGGNTKITCCQPLNHMVLVPVPVPMLVPSLLPSAMPPCLLSSGNADIGREKICSNWLLSDRHLLGRGGF